MFPQRSSTWPKSQLRADWAKTGWREVEIGRGSSDATCPIVALETWLKFARIAHGPLFRRVTGQGKKVGNGRLNDQEVARLVKRYVQKQLGHASAEMTRKYRRRRDRFRVNLTKASGL